jgi:two-component system cell cycle sensor histidine kinase/response regulator CckA
MAKPGILIVEDERIIAMDIKHSLLNLGYEVVGMAASGEDAIVKAGEACPDLILMDIMLQGNLDGIEAAEQIRQRYNIPMVYLTAYANDTILARAKITEPFGYVLKPFRETELHSNIEIALYRHEMEKKLQRREHWLAATLRSISDGVIATDVNGRVIFMNPVAELLTGWNQEEAIDQDINQIFQIFDEVTREAVELADLMVILKQDFFTPPTSNLLAIRDATERIIDHRVAPIINDVGRPIGLIFLFRDITEHRRLAAELARADKLDSIGTLAGGIAHDFNNLLTVIWANIILASLDAHLKDVVVERLAVAQKSCMEAQGLTQQLLTFSKEGGPIKKLAAIKKIILDAVMTFYSPEISITTEIPENLWPVEVDEYQIHQVINNLLTNAAQAIPMHGQVTIAAENIVIPETSALPLRTGNYLKITVQDQGVGIPLRYLDKIFDPFFTTKKQAIGMGLTVAYTIVKNHGGHVTVESEIGAGTAISFYLPAAYPPVKPVLVTGDRLIPGKGKVLLMDDDEMILDVIGLMLEKIGYQVGLAKTGAEAVELFNQALLTGNPFDAVILDSSVPGSMGGKETLAQLREVQPQVQAIISSGYANDPVMSDYKKYGFSAALPKPYKIIKLSETLNTILTNRQK